MFVGSAGCAAIGDWIADLALGDVNLFNETDDVIGGSIEVSDPDGETVLSETFDLTPSTDGEDDEDDGASFEDVWAGAGTYEASVTLDDAEVRGDSEATESVTIDDPDEEMLAVVFGADEFEEGIAFSVAEAWSEFGQE